MVRTSDDDGDRLRIGVLGPLVLEVGGAPVEVPGTKRRAVLALLALASPDPVGPDRLIDALWPDDAPGSGRAALQSHITRLRRHLGPFAGRLTNTDAGYRLALEAGELDAAEVAELVREARAQADAAPATACATLTDALSRWRGPPLVELAAVEPVAAWARAATEQLLEASDLLVDCALRSDDPAAAAAAAQRALVIDPLREQTVHGLMRALAAQHRTVDALRAAHDLRRRMREETGLDPSAALTALESELAAAADGPAPSAPGPAASPAPAPPGAPGSPAAPEPVGQLFGREAELTGLERLVASERLVTIVGPGGVGKTRLAIEVARRAASSHATAFVDLSAVVDPATVPDALARTLGVEAGAGDPVARCMNVLRGQPHLLLLDNCEHLLGAVRPLVLRLLSECPDLTVLATSRERLAVPGEQSSALAPLPMPGSRKQGAVEEVPSVALFLDRARRARTTFSADAGALASVARIVRALDGLPLAIELAAGRVSSLGLTDLEARLDRALDLLGGATVDAHGRHRTLRAAVAWSYELLDPEEQLLFRHLAVFPGGFDLPTAEDIAASLGTTADAATMVAHLVDSSMVVADLDGTPRYRMLDTLRSFGLDRLAAHDETDAAHGRLVRWATAVAAELDAAYETEAEPAADQRLRIELPNLRAAWRLARDAGDLAAAAALAVDLYAHASWRELTELFRWSLELADDPALEGHPYEAQVLGVAAEAAWASTGDLQRAEAYARRGLAALRPDDDRGRALATWALADVRLFLGRYAEAAELAVAAREGTRWIAEGYAQAAIAWAYGGDLARAREMVEAASARVGGPTLRAYVRYIEGELANLGGDPEAAKGAYREAIAGARSVGASFIGGIASVGLVTAQTAAGDVADALDGYRELLDLWERTGAWTQQWTTLRNLASLLEQLGDGPTADLLRAAADRAPEAASVAGTERSPLADPAAAAENRATALRAAREAITRAAAAR